MSHLKTLWQGLLHLVYPNVCALCGADVPPERPPFCEPCWGNLTNDPHETCPRCAATVGPHVDLANGCTHCRDAHLRFDAAIRMGVYDDRLRDLVLRLKNVHSEWLAELVGNLWAGHAAERFRDLRADVIVPVPLHWFRRFRRGYNQSASLARGLAERLDIPCRPGWLRRIRNTPQQTSKPMSARRENVRGAFRAAWGVPLQGRTVLLVDDVMTTGSTASEAAGALRTAGAKRVVVAALARARV